ncbi:MAG: hypothetical protein WAV40_01380 [Microgenomates group bacterium]
MQLLVNLLDFVVLVIILASLRQRLVYELSGTSLLLFGSTAPGLTLYSILVLPGTIIHELSHWIVAEVLGVRTGKITIFPDFSDNDNGSSRLGSVSTQRSDPFRAFLIGVAPFISGLTILAVLGAMLARGWHEFAWWIVAIMIYGVMVIGNSMMISKEDRRTWPFIIVIFSLLVVLVGKYYPSLIFDHTEQYLSILRPLISVLVVTAGLNLVMIVGCYAMRRLIERITGKRIIHK